MSIIGQTHIGIFVSDLDRSCDFYHDVLQFEVLWKGELDDPEGPVKVAELKNNDLILELVRLYNYENRPHPGTVDHIAVKTDDVYAEFQRMKSLGYQPLSEDVVVDEAIFGRGGKWFFILGPDGERIEIAQ